MKKSVFNIVEKIEEGILLYNTNSNSILKLDQEYKEKYYKFLQTGKVEDNLFREALLRGNMIVEEEFGDEVEKLFLENKIARFGGNSIGLTIAPTMSCNFRCPYCYEKGREYVTMSKETVEKVKEYFVNLKEHYHNIGITWYGGEPLLAVPIIEELMKSVYNNFSCENVSANVITNGYLLTEDVVRKMKEFNISNIQITIDGPPEIHNKRRCLPSGEDTFFVILTNMRKALEIYPELRISIRVNIDKSNVDGVDKIIQYLEKYDLVNRTFLYLAPVTNINETCTEGSCFNTREFAKEELSFFKRNSEKGYSFINLPQRNVAMCGAVSSNSCIIDARGDLYKCWDDVSNLDEKVGSLYDKSSSMNANLVKWLSHTIENDEECRNCSYLPVCMGGCPNYWIKNKKKNCVSIKESSNQFVRLVYDIEKQRKKRSV